MPAPKNYVKIQYPRKCEHCDYISNNPSMYYYHKQTHDPIPDGKLCDHGCGNQAQYRTTGGVYSCSKISQHCPGYLKEHSSRIKQQWNGAHERKEKTKKSLVERLHNESTYQKLRETLKKKHGNFTPDQMKDFRHYAQRIRSRAQKWAKAQGYLIGPNTYHVDHKLSIYDAFRFGLSEDVVNHPCNLQILEAKQNSQKGNKSIITVNELLLAIRQS